LVFDETRVDKDFYLIFEDDCDFIDKACENLYTHLGHFNYDFDIFWIGGRFEPGFTVSNPDHLSRFFTRVEPNLYVSHGSGEGYASVGLNHRERFDCDRTTHAYFISKSGARKLVEQTILLARRGEQRAFPVDHFMRHQRNSLCNLDIFPHVTHSPGGPSDIRK
jgi:hypothetical protein